MTKDFTDTMLYSALSIPKEQWNKSNGYSFFLRLPVIVIVFIVAICTAIIIDSYISINEL